MKKEAPYYLFVYGTLRKEVDVPVKKEIRAHIEWVGTSEIRGTLYDMGHYPAALPTSENERSIIKGDVIKISHPEKVFELLDAYEGYNPKALHESEYYRATEAITLEDGSSVTAWVYWYNFPVAGKTRIQQQDYLQYLETKNTV